MRADALTHASLARMGAVLAVALTAACGSGAAIAANLKELGYVG